MDRKIVYAGQIPLETDLLGTNQNAMVALGKLAGAILGTTGIVNGLAVGPNTPAAMNVVVAAGEIYQLQNLEATAYSSLPADTVHTVVKQGILQDPVTLACPAPPTAGFSTNYLIEAAYVDADVSPSVLPYYNASNPSQAFSGPGGNGTAQATNRAGQVQVQVKAGIAAASGTQVTPATDNGYIALAVVTVANGQTSITAGNIVASGSASILGTSLLAMINNNSPGRLLNVRVFATAGTSTYVPTAGATSYEAELIGGGGGGGGAVSATSGSTVALGSGGGGGGYARKRGTIASISGQTITVGAAGAGAAGANGTAGGTSSIGAIVSATGGAGGAVGTAQSITTSPAGGGAAGGQGTNGDVNARGGFGAGGFSSSPPVSGGGGASFLGTGATGAFGTSGGNVSPNPGGGGGGGVLASGGPAAGGAGGAGLVIIREYA